MATALGRGVYSFSEAARLTGVNAQRLQYWFLRGKAANGPVHAGDYSGARSGRRLLSFLDLVDGLVVGRLRTRGYALGYLRKVHRALVTELDTPHPFSRKDLLTDGKRIFLSIAHEVGDDRLLEVVTRQHAFPEILRPYLRPLEYHPSSLLARRWHISEGIVIDPGRQYGKPIVDAAGISTAVIFTAYGANGDDAALVADWYGIRAAEVEAAVAFERAHGGSAA